MDRCLIFFDTVKEMAKVIIIDGNNLIHRIPLLKHLVNRDFPQARERLKEMLAIYLKKRPEFDITLIFDNTQMPGSKETYKGINILFPGVNHPDADSLIKDIVARKDRFYIVVSSDRSVYDYAQSKGAVPIRSDEFAKKLKAACTGNPPVRDLSVKGSRIQKKRMRILEKL